MFKPTGSQVLVKQMPVKAERESGIITMSSSEQKRQQLGENIGILVDAGPMAWEFVDDDGKTFKLEQAMPGDVVLFQRYSGIDYQESKLKGEATDKGEPSYRIMSSADIVGVMDKEEAIEYKRKRGVKE